MKIDIPELSLVVLIGPSGAGKSTFARRHFKETEILSSDYCRALVADDETDQSVTREAFEILHFITAKRLAAGRLTVIDATNVQPEARKPLIALARQYHVLPVAIVFDLPERVCRDRNAHRTDRQIGGHVIHRQIGEMRRGLRGLQKEGFRTVITLDEPARVEEAFIERTALYNNRKQETGPFDIIGDIHGCLDELVALLTKLGYQVGPDLAVQPPAGRRALFLGDLVDRGPATPGVLKLVMAMVEAGSALCVPGNHDVKLVRALRGRNVKVGYGLAESLAQLEQESPAFREQVVEFLDGLVSHYVLDGGRLVVAHAGLPEAMHGRASMAVREFCLYGETTGETDEYGLPVRLNWAADYRGQSTVVYGHTPVPEPEWLNRTINIDTGCVFGGRLTALRYPERELVAVDAAQTYTEPVRPLQAAGTGPTGQQAHDDLLDFGEFTGRRTIETRLQGRQVIPEENATAALEVMGRFGVNPKWVIYLPPTMSPSKTSESPDLLEHPSEAFAYFRQNGLHSLVCQEKHMGSRVVVVVGRSEEAIRRRFGIVGEGHGICYTRTGRRFFDDPSLEAGLIDQVRQAMERAGLWERLQTDWICLDAELMPWSAKAKELLLRQYAAVGAAGETALGEVLRVMEATQARGLDLGDLPDRYRAKQSAVDAYRAAYRRYCWQVTGLEDLRLAPFHLLVSEGAVHTEKDHRWHMEVLAELAGAGGPLLMQTEHRYVDLADESSVTAAVQWWQELTGRGGEGMVVKPLSFIARSEKGHLIQPAVKVRGREYLRIIYGPEYTFPDQIDRLRARGLSVKRQLALKEFALGIEALERFVLGEPLRRVHECVLGVLALESEPVDPWL